MQRFVGSPRRKIGSSKQEEDLLRGYNLAGHSYIQMPVDFDRFRETIMHLGYYWPLVISALLNIVPSGNHDYERVAQ